MPKFRANQSQGGRGGESTPAPPPPPTQPGGGPQNNPGGYTQAALATACELVVGVISLEQTQALKV